MSSAVGYGPAARAADRRASGPVRGRIGVPGPRRDGIPGLRSRATTFAGWRLRRRWRLSALWLPVVFGALAAGCAREAAPPGGPPDRLPPIVIASEPDTFSTVEPFRSPVTLRFSERISERPSAGTLDQAVVVSPVAGEVRVSHGREGLSVRVLDGFEVGRVYRLTVLPVIQDMFGNSLQEPYELFFSTGPEFVSNVVAGSVIDRLTGLPLRDARVDAAVAGSDVVYTALTDSAGIFAMRYLPAGDFVVSAYLDRNRNGTPDFTEPQGMRPAPVDDNGPAADTAIVLDVPLLTPDTTAARLARAAVADSISLTIFLDDFLDTELPLDDVRVTVTSDSVDGPRPLAVLHEHEAELYRSALADSIAREQAVRDSIARAEAAQDSVAAAQADTAAEEAAAAQDSAAAEPAGGAVPAEAQPPAPVEQEAAGTGAEQAERPPAAQNFIVILDGVLVPEVPYEVEISNITNINGVGGGGGTVSFTRPAPPPPPEDTTRTVADSLTGDTIPGAPPATDTVGRDTVPADSAAGQTAPEDTLALPADSASRDTIPTPPPDSARRDTIPPPPGDSVPRDTIPPPPGDSLRRDTVSASPGASVRRGLGPARSGAGALMPPARKRSVRSSRSRTS